MPTQVRRRSIVTQLAACGALALLLAGGAPTRAADPEPDRARAACAAEAAQVLSLKQSLDACDAAVREVKAKEQACRTLAGAEAERVAACRSTLRTTEASRDALCRTVGEFGRAVAEGEPPTVTLEGCLPAQRQEQIAAELNAWRRVQPQLDGLLQFVGGERRNLPPPVARGSLPVERTVAELVASDRMRPPIVYRRLLTSAIDRVAPRFWARLAARGPAGVAAWFASRATLDADLVAEARAVADVPQDTRGAAGPPLAAGLKFVQTYLDVAGCSRLAAGARDCGRARQLQQLLESSGPLLVERRVEAIWASDCRTLGPKTVLEWLQDFPSSQQRVDEAQWAHVTENGFTKLQTCFLGATTDGPSAAAWIGRRLPSPSVLTGAALARLSRIRQRLRDDSDEELCGRAVRAIQRMQQPVTCALDRDIRGALAEWLPRETSPARQPPSAALRVCSDLLHALWEGKEATVDAAFARPPAAAELVGVVERFSGTPMARLRRLCDERHGDGALPEALAPIAAIAPAMGDRVEDTPWRLQRATGIPLEQVRFTAVAHLGSWLRNLYSRDTACAALGLPAHRCAACAADRASSAFDCGLVRDLERRWARWRRMLWTTLVSAVGIVLLLVWSVRMVSARRRFGGWARLLRGHLDGVGIRTVHHPLASLMPSRVREVTIELPSTPVWERWGRRAIVSHAAGGSRVLDRDVNHAATRARVAGVNLAILAHEDGASPDLGAVRALLEWAARGAGKAVQVLPLAASRLQAIQGAEELLELVELSSVRGNPFELRGRVTSASQFFDRERLVSGLLADVQAGNWVFVGGLRRFGKSSLALEVARRLPGPSAYVDLAAFHHEITVQGDAADAADAILRYASLRLHQSAVERYGAGARLPAPLPAAGTLAAAEVTEWFRAFVAVCARAPASHPEPILLILDELEQAIGTDPDLLPRAVQVLSIVLGRLRGALSAPAAGASRGGVLLCGAIHPIVWAPLPSLAGQSIMGAFQSVFVPRLPDDAAWSMMRGLGARQGIRFTDPALQLIVEQGHGVPLLIRRLASSVLELYDPERARQGALGAVEIGIEGATAAMRREEEAGSPLRGWIESEIAEAHSVTGALLRRLARDRRVTKEGLRATAAAEVRARFAATGVDRLLGRDELGRRATEAAAVIVRMLGEIGLLVPEGNPIDPEAYVLQDGLLTRILADDTPGRAANA